MPWRRVPARLGWAALIGLQFGLFEIARLERGGFELDEERRERLRALGYLQ